MKIDDVTWERKKEENIKLVSHTHEYLNEKCSTIAVIRRLVVVLIVCD